MEQAAKSSNIAEADKQTEMQRNNLPITKAGHNVTAIMRQPPVK
jgi:hypothetical protein